MKKFTLILFASILSTALISTAVTYTMFNKLSENKNFNSNSRTASAELVGQHLNTKPVSLPEDFVTTSAKVTPAIVNIEAERNGQRRSNGSGVIISSDGYIITNHHVVNDGTSFEVTTNDKRTFKAKIVGNDPTTDLALLKVEATDLVGVEFGDSDNIKVGEWVLAVGNPFNLTSTVTLGIVSAKARNINILPGEYSVESFIQTDAVVNPGNSGGALVNSKGELIGINAAILTETGVYEGYSFAIPANLVRKVMNDLREFKEVRRAILGIRISDVDENIAAKFNLPGVSGVLIDSVNANSSAEDAGLRSGDVIIEVNGKITDSTPELQEQVARFRPGERISLKFIRNGKKLTKTNIKLKGLASN